MSLYTSTCTRYA